jgi:hypothetical protein
MKPEVGKIVRHVSDGQLGKVVESTDGLMVRLDRNSQEIIMPYNPHSWLEVEKASFTAVQIAKVQYAADCAYRECLGEYRLPEWISLTDQQRQGFIGRGPATDDPVRRRMFDTISKLLK